MADSKLTPYLLDETLLNYTLECTQAALSDGAAESTRKRARFALEFFLSLLDPAVDNERTHRETYQIYLEALDKGKPSPISLPDPPRSAGSFHLSAARSVLNLPETLGEILSHISPLSAEGRSAFHSASLVSRSFHKAADLALWQLPRDLDTVEQQVRFAFGAAISGALSDPLGNQVEGLRIRRMPGGWNERVIVKIAQLCPRVESLLLHCGDSGDEEDHVTQSFVNTVHEVLSSLPNLKELSLYKFSYTSQIEGVLEFASDGHVPFARLASLHLYDFGWYWPVIAKGLGSNLKSLDLDLLPSLTSEQLIALAKQLTSLTSLSISSFVELEPLREFLSRGLIEHLQLKQFSGHDDKYANEVVSIATAKLPSLKRFTLRGVEIGVSEFEMLTSFRAPLEEIGVHIHEGVSNDDSNGMISKLVKSKCKTLNMISIDFEGQFELHPSEELISALAGCPLLEQILIPFAPPIGLPSAAVDSLLRQCAKLKFSESLETLCKGNELYQKEYEKKLQREEEIIGEEEVILGN